MRLFEKDERKRKCCEMNSQIEFKSEKMKYLELTVILKSKTRNVLNEKNGWSNSSYLFITSWEQKQKEKGKRIKANYCTGKHTHILENIMYTQRNYN